MTLERVLATPAATQALGRRLAQVVRAAPGGLLALQGPLGAGKTTLVRALLRALGVDGPVRSPTYTLLEPYALDDVRLVHLDLYRLSGPDELEPLGLDAYPLQTHWWLVEWPERGVGALPAPALTVQLSMQGAGRLARIDGPLAPALSALPWPDGRRT